MSRINIFWNSLLGKPIILFTLARYFIYFLLFVRGILLASTLGPDKFGLFSLIYLISQYLVYAGIGMQFAINVNLAKGKEIVSDLSKDIVISTSINFSVVVLLILVGITSSFSVNIPFLESEVSEYLTVVALIASLFLIQQVLLNIFRVYGKTNDILIVELITAVTLICVIFMVDTNNLIDYMLYAIVLTSLFSILYYLIKKPFKYYYVISSEKFITLIKLGFPLLLLNLCTMMITMYPQFISGIYYGNEPMGYYSFAVRLSTAIMLGVNTVVWYIFPGLITKLANSGSQQKYDITLGLTKKLSYSVLLLSFLTMMFSSVIFKLMPEYSQSYEIMNVLILSQALMIMGFAFNSLIISHNGQSRLSIFLMGNGLFVIMASYIFVSYNINYFYLVSITFVASLLYLIVNLFLGWKLALTDYNLKFLSLFPLSIMAATLLGLMLTFLGFPLIASIMGLVILLLFSRKELVEIIRSGVKGVSVN